MSTIELVTRVLAPQKRCFDLARSIDLHVRSTSRTGERAVAGVTTGLIGPNEEVTWEAKHFGVRQRFTSKITAFDPPRYFQDSMARGVGRILDRILLSSYLERFLLERNEIIKRVAESDSWRDYLGT